MKLRRNILTLALLGFPLAVATGMGCKKGDKSKDDSTSPNQAAMTGTLKLSLGVVTDTSPTLAHVSLSSLSNFGAPRGLENFFSGKAVASSGAGLESLKLQIGSIIICKGMTFNGTAISQTDGCLTLYSYNSTEPDINNTMDTGKSIAAALKSDDGYIDILNATDREKLNKSVQITAADAREYSFGLISWAPPVKAKATLSNPADGQPVLYTRAGTAGQCKVNELTYTCVRTTTPLTTTGAQEAVFINSENVGFKFQKPFVITADDIASRKEFNLKLAFNPQGLIQGVVAPGATNFPPLVDGTADDGRNNVGNTISLVGAQVAPVFYSATAKVMRESYSAVLPENGNGNGTYQLRVEFYYVSDDSQKSIQGVSTATLPTADTVSYLTGFHRIYSIKENTDTSLDLLNYEAKTKIASFLRTNTVGQTTTAKVECTSDVPGCDADGFLNATFTLDAVDAL
ncbi:MAG: hypothetical protein RIR26_894 [Pseudomonadota bacterium]|jgi:hypothetical protein